MDTNEATGTNSQKEHIDFGPRMDRKVLNHKIPEKENHRNYHSVFRVENGRLKARLQAASAGLQELTILRETQQALVEQAKKIVKKNEKNVHEDFEKLEKCEVGTNYFLLVINAVIQKGKFEEVSVSNMHPLYLKKITLLKLVIRFDTISTINHHFLLN